MELPTAVESKSCLVVERRGTASPKRVGRCSVGSHVEILESFLQRMGPECSEHVECKTTERYPKFG